MAGFYSCLKTPKTGSTMADRPRDLLELPEGEDAGEDFTRKKKSRFQSFKNFFAKKKKNREPPSPVGESKLKPSQSNSELCAPNLNSGVLHLLTEPGSKGCMGSKALSHDSVFISESLPDVTSHSCSQENLPGKAKALQLWLQQNLQLGSPSLVIAGKKTEDGGAISEDDGLPRSPLEISTLHDILTCSTRTSPNPAQRHSSLSLGGTDSEDDQVSSEPSSAALSPLSATALGSPAFPGGPLLPVDFDSPATPLGCLDTSAAKHRIAMNPRKQKALASKAQRLPVGRAGEEQRLPRTAEGKTSHGKSAEEPGGQQKDWKGPYAQDANVSNGEWISGALPLIKTSGALRYSWNAGPGTDWENQTLTDAELQADSPKAQPPFARGEEEDQREADRRQGTDGATPELRRRPHSVGKERVGGLASWQTQTEPTEPSDVTHATLNDDVAGQDAGALSKGPRLPEPKANDSGVGSKGIYGGQVEARAAEGNSFVTTGAHPVLMRLPSSSLAGPSEAEEDVVSTSENSQTGRSADTTLQWLEGRETPTDAPREELAIEGDADPDRPPRRNMAGEKPFLSGDLGGSVLSPSRGTQDALHHLGHLGLRGLAATASAEAVAQGVPPADNAGDRLGNVKTGEGNKTPDEGVKPQCKSVSAKPVRFTIAPAWQRSLSGGSNSTDGSCPRSSPSSPVRSELFEGMPPLDSTVETRTPNDPERHDPSSRDAASDSNPATEWPNEDVQGQESPFGVKLRRTSSLLRYQMEQKHPELPKPFPGAVSRSSSVSVKAEPKSPGSGTPLPDLPSGGKGLLAKCSSQEPKKPLKSKREEETTKQQMGRPSERLPPAWISVAKVKQRGFQGHPFAPGQKKEERASSAMEPQRGKRIRIDREEKQVSPIGENIVKKASSGQGCVLQSTTLPKLTIPATKAPQVRTAAQEAPRLEKETRALPSLPLSSCSPAEPPWLSLAKKKAKAWSEMPQIVQ